MDHVVYEMDNMVAGEMATHFDNLVASNRRTDRLYRSYGPGGMASTLGCGTIRKPSSDAVHTRFCIGDIYSGVYLLQGSGVYRDEVCGELRLTSGDWFNRIPGREHESIPDSDGRWVEFFVAMPAQWYSLHESAGMFSPRGPVWHPGQDGGLLEECLGLRERLKDPRLFQASETLVAMQACVLHAWHLHRRNSGPEGGDRLDGARALLEQALDTPADLPAVASACGMGYENFRKEFRRRFGISPGAYRQRARMDRARALLARPELQVKQVAARLGFPDAYAFSKQFKRALGVAPSTYRQRVPH